MSKCYEREPPMDYYDGKPKRCNGSGSMPRAVYTGEITQTGERLYVFDCQFCGMRASGPDRMDEHTFIPVRIEELTFSWSPGRCIEGIEIESPLTAADPNRAKGGGSR